MLNSGKCVCMDVSHDPARNASNTYSSNCNQVFFPTSLYPHAQTSSTYDYWFVRTNIQFKSRFIWESCSDIHLEVTRADKCTRRKETERKDCRLSSQMLNSWKYMCMDARHDPAQNASDTYSRIAIKDSSARNKINIASEMSNSLMDEFVNDWHCVSIIVSRFVCECI